MSEYENIIPFLRQQYEKEMLDLDESITLEEDKIPKPLLIAYKRGWNDNGTTMARETTSRYGLEDQAPNHNVIASARQNYNANRRAIRWDLGKAYYKELSKQEAVDLLGIKIYKGRRKNQLEEISINDPIPEELTVIAEGTAAKENINKLRFLIKQSENDYRLTEFEYREETTATGKTKEQFFPIFRDYFSSSKIDELGIKYRDSGMEGRVKDFVDWNSIKTVYFVIKLADLIYETDEYDHPLGLGQLDDGWISRGNDINTLSNWVKRYLYLGIINKYLNKVIDKFNLDKEDIFDKLASQGVYNFDEFISTLKECGSDLQENIDLDTLIKVMEAYNLVDKGYNLESENKTFKELLTEENILPLDAKSWFNDNLMPLLDSDYKQLLNDNVDDLVWKIQDYKLNNLPDGRLKDVWTRRIKNSRRYIIRKNKSGDHIGNPEVVDFNPYDTYQNRTVKYSVPEVSDTGRHMSTNVSMNKQKFDLQILNDPTLLEELKDYIRLLAQRRKVKANYIRAYNYYQEVKNQSKYFDSDEEYDALLQDAKDNYINKKAEYIGGKDADGVELTGILRNIKEAKKKFNIVLDRDSYNISRKINNHLSYLQSAYKKLITLRDLVKNISYYTEEDFEKLYGFENKEEFEKLNRQIQELVNVQQQRTDKIHQYQLKIAELQEELARITNDLETEEVNFDSANKEIHSLEEEKDKLSSSIENAIRAAYKDQAEFNKLANNIDKEITKHKYQTKKSGEVKVDNNKKQTDERFLQLVREFGNDNKDAELLDEPDSEDILSDDEEESPIVMDKNSENIELNA